MKGKGVDTLVEPSNGTVATFIPLDAKIAPLEFAATKTPVEFWSIAGVVDTWLKSGESSQLALADWMPA